MPGAGRGGRGAAVDSGSTSSVAEARGAEAAAPPSNTPSPAAGEDGEASTCRRPTARSGTLRPREHAAGSACREASYWSRRHAHATAATALASRSTAASTLTEGNTGLGASLVEDVRRAATRRETAGGGAAARRRSEGRRFRRRARSPSRSRDREARRQRRRRGGKRLAVDELVRELARTRTATSACRSPSHHRGARSRPPADRAGTRQRSLARPSPAPSKTAHWSGSSGFRVVTQFRGRQVDRGVGRVAAHGRESPATEHAPVVCVTTPSGAARGDSSRSSGEHVQRKGAGKVSDRRRRQSPRDRPATFVQSGRLPTQKAPSPPQAASVAQHVPLLQSHTASHMYTVPAADAMISESPNRPAASSSEAEAIHGGARRTPATGARPRQVAPAECRRPRHSRRR